MRLGYILGLSLMLSIISCDEGLELDTVKSVDIEKYAGTWYEIARLPNSFEKGMSCVAATYTPLKNGKIEVKNAGVLKAKNNEKKDIIGKAWVPDSSNPGQLKVQFFWPFSGDYYIMELDQDYKYALVGSPTRNFLWVLSRTPKLEESIITSLLAKAKDARFDVDKVERIAQDCN